MEPLGKHLPNLRPATNNGSPSETPPSSKAGSDTGVDMGSVSAIQKWIETLNNPETPTSEGVLLSRFLPADPMGAKDLDHLLNTLTAAFGLDYYDEDSPGNMRAMMVYEQAREDGWSATDFRKRIRSFVKSQRFATWTPADFFGTERPKVYGHQWYCEQTTPPKGSAGNIPLIDAYRVPYTDKPVWGWRSEVGDSLPEHVPTVAPEARQLEGPTIQGETARALDLTKEVLRLQVVNGDLQAEVKALQRRNRELQEDYDALQSIVDQYVENDCLTEKEIDWDAVERDELPTEKGRAA